MYTRGGTVGAFLKATSVGIWCAYLINNYMTSLSSEDIFLRNSTLYKEFLAERNEILRHKWFMSERAGRDVGFERALLDWNFNFREGWRKERKV